MMPWNPGGKRHPIARGPAPVPPPVVGSRIDAYCKKCKNPTSHVLVRKLASIPTWVQCSVCESSHAFRAPSDTPAARRPPSRSDAPAARNADPEETWKKCMGAARGPSTDYSTRLSYRPGQRLSHPSFGEGVVTRQISSTVCTAVFVTGEVKLLMGNVRPSA